MENVQKYQLCLGKSGCYFDTLIHVCEMIKNQEFDAVKCFSECLEKKYIDLDCFVSRPDLIIKLYTGKSCVVAKCYDLTYKAKKNEYLVGRYVWNNSPHFVLLDHNYKVVFDPYGKSNTVKNGELESLRIISIL